MLEDLKELFNKHPRSVGENWWTHLLFTLKMSYLLFLLVVVLLIHGLIPFLFRDTVSGYFREVIMPEFEKRGGREQ